MWNSNHFSWLVVPLACQEFSRQIAYNRHEPWVNPDVAQCSRGGSVNSNMNPQTWIQRCSSRKKVQWWKKRYSGEKKSTVVEFRKIPDFGFENLCSPGYPQWFTIHPPCLLVHYPQPVWQHICVQLGQIVQQTEKKSARNNAEPVPETIVVKFKFVLALMWGWPLWRIEPLFLACHLLCQELSGQNSE